MEQVKQDVPREAAGIADTPPTCANCLPEPFRLAFPFAIHSSADGFCGRISAVRCAVRQFFCIQMTCDSREFFKLFFRELEAKNIAYVILHSYQEFPDKISSDIDYAVPDADLPRLRKIQIDLAKRNGWALVQTLQHGVFAFYAVLVNLNNPEENLKLDACSNYARVRRQLVPEKVLLAKRVRYRDFFVPAPAAEFIYMLAKIFDAKNKSPEQYLPRLRELWQRDADSAQKHFTDLFGDTGRSLKEWFASPAKEWERLGQVMLARHHFGPLLLLRETARLVRRAFQPAGLCLAVMGSDGAGKSTLLARLQILLEPCFRQQKMLHFRPAIFEKRKTGGAVTDPHGQKPRGWLSSWLKVGYYFLDHWIGWFWVVLPGKIRSTLIIFDRNFDDVLVDQKRYRLQGSGMLVKILRKLLPQADRVFVLSAPAEILRQRKPELPLPELERQQQILQELASSGGRYRLVSAEAAPEDVARTVWLDVVSLLAQREERRG
jgi:thymidylate kinase